MNNSGIYRIVNLKNNKVYIGSSISLKDRKYKHLLSLRNDKHCNTYLQNAFNKYGESNFKWEIVEYVVDKEELLKREQYWIDYYKESKKLYNLRSSAERKPISEYTETKRGTLSCREDWIPYYNMYINEGKSFRDLEKLLGVCHKSIKRKLEGFDFRIIENGVYTTQGWLDKKNIKDWKSIHDIYINENKSLNYLQNLLSLDKTQIKEIFIGLGLEIKSNCVR